MGVTSMVGQIGEVRQPLMPVGTVQVGGELWSADASGETVMAGELVQVAEVHGLKLRVRKVNHQ
jgi:membrane-bound ClpP family serine protease